MRIDHKPFVFTLLIGFAFLPLMSSFAQSVSVGDAIDLGVDFKEATVVAYGVNENRQCKEGRLIFAHGGQVILTDLNGNRISGPERKPPFTRDDGTFSLTADNHLVKRRDPGGDRGFFNGSLILSVVGITWNDNIQPHPYWWEMTKNHPLKGKKLPGGRGIAYFFRSVDCGMKWERVSEIDAAKFPVPLAQVDVASVPASLKTVTVEGYFAVPRLKLEDGEYSQPAGGWDGHYLYADPYTGHLFFSSIGIRGKSTNKDNMSNLGEQEHHIVAISKDQGRSWNICLLAYGSYSFRAPVTSLPTGEVAVAYPSDDGKFVLTILTPPYDKPIIISSTNRNQFTILRERGLYTNGKIISIPENINPKPQSSFNTASDGKRHVIKSSEMVPVFKETGGPGFIIARNLWAKRRAADHFTFAQGLFFVPKSLAVNWKLPQPLDSMMVLSPRVTPHEKGDTFHGTLIAGLPTESLNVFYWVESNLDVRDGTPELFRVKFMVLNGLKPVSPEPGELTVSNKVSAPWPMPNPTDWVGDYMSGTSFRSFTEKQVGRRVVHEDDGKRHFVATWNEAGTLKFNIVTVVP